MKKKTSKIIAIVMCMLTAVAFMPTFAFAADAGSNEIAAAKDAKVYITVNNQGTLAKAKDGSVMFNKSMAVKDINKDGILTYDEALVAAHKAYNKAANYATTESDYGTTVTKLWGVETYNTLFFVNGAGITSGVGTDSVKAGDKLYASVNSDNTYYSDYYTQFDKSKVTVKKGKKVTLTLTGFPGMAGGESATLAGIKVGTWNKGKFSTKTVKATTGSNGKATLKFKKKGTYYVTAKGSVTTMIDTDWDGTPDTLWDCPIMAPGCKVVVK